MSDISILSPSYLRRRYRLDTFVETGCYRGESLAQAYAAGFSRAISCDINPECVADCRKRFPNAAIFRVESTTLLGPLLPQLLPAMGSTLFWLDAHFPATYGLAETEDTRFPLAEELRLIRQNKPDHTRDVIAFDDVRVFRDPENPRYRPNELQGSERDLYVDMSLEQLIAPFAGSHEAFLVPNQEGALILLPTAVPPPDDRSWYPTLGECLEGSPNVCRQP